MVTRRAKFELKKLRERAHILEGYRIALQNLDAVIKLIRESRTPPIAREGLMHTFAMSEKQAQAVLDLQLHRLTSLEIEKIEKEYAEMHETHRLPGRSAFQPTQADGRGEG